MNLSGPLCVLFETILFMKETSMLSRLDLIRNDLNSILMPSKLMMSQLEGTKYQYIPQILYNIVHMQAAPSPDNGDRYQLASFLLKAVDQQKFSAENFHNLCLIFNS